MSCNGRAEACAGRQTVLLKTLTTLHDRSQAITLLSSNNQVQSTFRVVDATNVFGVRPISHDTADHGRLHRATSATLQLAVDVAVEGHAH